MKVIEVSDTKPGIFADKLTAAYNKGWDLIGDGIVVRNSAFHAFFIDLDYVEPEPEEVIEEEVVIVDEPAEED